MNKTKKQKDREIFTEIVNYTPKNERISWNRKHKKLKRLISDKLSPIEEKMLELTMQKQGVLDEIIAIRDELAKECVHPREFLFIREHDNKIICKFCDAKLRISISEEEQ
jgi:uncharacterized Zn-finger protein